MDIFADGGYNLHVYKVAAMERKQRVILRSEFV
jgi:hypothetical protein